MRQSRNQEGDLTQGRRHVIAAAVQWFRIAFLGTYLNPDEIEER